MPQVNPSGIVTLLTDFGLVDTYVGQMKGVLLGIDRTLSIVDLTHDVPPQDIPEGAFQLAAAIDAFPPGTVHVAVVDPGVGSSRRAIVAECDAFFVVAPDNGLISLIRQDVRAAYSITNASLFRETRTSTFHGRDIFAPFAGLIASGKIRPNGVGDRLAVESLEMFESPVAVSASSVSGEIASIDRFGNCITLIGADQLPPDTMIDVRCGDFNVNQVSKTYSDVAVGQALALVGSYGTLELSVRDGNAAESFRLERGHMVQIRLSG